MKRLAVALTILVASVGAAEADLLLGITATQLVSIDPANPATVTPIGALNLPANITQFALAWDPAQQQLFGLGYERSGAAIVNQHLIGYDIQTGQGTLLAALGSPATAGLYEALEYVDALGTLIASREGTLGSQVTTRLVRLAANGSTSLQATTTRDNDYAVYDPVRNVFYTTDPNGVGQLVRIDLGTGAATNLGAIPLTLGALAFSDAAGGIFAVSYANSNFYRVDTTNGGSPITPVLIGQVAGAPVVGLAFVPSTPVPEPSTWLLLGSGLAALGLLRHRRARRPR